MSAEDPERMKKHKHFASPSWKAVIGLPVYILERVDPYTRGHSQRVQISAKKMGRILVVKQPEVWTDYLYACLSVSSLLHDVGKIVVGTTTLQNQNSELTPEQHHEISDHPYESSVIIRRFIPVKDIVQGAFYHHERWDGEGYPHGLRGDEIPPISRVIAVCDAYDAMVTSRSYKKEPLSRDAAVEIILRSAGTQFDPEYAKVFAEEVAPKL